MPPLEHGSLAKMKKATGIFKESSKFCPDLVTDFGFSQKAVANFEGGVDSRCEHNFEGGETIALKRLKHYLYKSKKIDLYKLKYRTYIEAEYTSKLSPWLSNGSLSSRKVYYAVKQFEKKNGASRASGYFLN
jgi:deoxyribodipyrimidine photolyase